jgi:predicted DCC family thiol-disulfide oxidoreductase YuxK
MNVGAAQEVGRHLILYDGVCGLCNKWVGQIMPRDPKAQFHFASLQSDLGRSLLTRYGKNPDILDTIYVLVDYKSAAPRILARSRAALFVIARLDGPWRFLKIFELLPTFILDAGYSLIARYRYRFFGRYDQCLMPGADYASRFIDL